MDGLTWIEFLLTLKKAFNASFVPPASGTPVGSAVPVLRRDLPDGTIKEMVLHLKPQDGSRVVPPSMVRNVLDRLGITSEEWNDA
jgi:hypothetical protein